MDQNAIQTPSSSNRRTTHNEAINRMQNPMLRNIPTADEMDEFFAREEKQQQTLFIEKYKFFTSGISPVYLLVIYQLSNIYRCYMWIFLQVQL